jgi:hypothetical protein
MSEKNQVRFNLCVVREKEVNSTTGLQHWCEPCETLSKEDAHTQWEVGSNEGDEVVAMCEVVFSDEDNRPYAETYEALNALNALSDEPRVQDLLTRIFTLGFEAGLRCKQEEVRKTLGLS